MFRSSFRGMNHSTAEFFEAVTEFNILHPIDMKFLVETSRLSQQIARGGDIPRVIVRKIDRTAGNAVWIKYPPISKIPKERVS